jgi:hypothetical protein
MSKLRDLRGQLTVWVLTALCWTAMAGVALAQDDKDKDPSAPTPYLLPYVLVGAGVGLGLLVLFRPTNRSDGIKRETLPGTLSAAQLKSHKKAPQAAAKRGKEVSPDAKNALILSIVGAVVPVVGLLIGPLALWKAAGARKAIKQNPRLTGDNLAVAGMVVGGVAILIGVVWLVIFVSLAM